MYIWQNIALADVAGLVELQKWKWRPPLISGSWWRNYPELLTGLFIFNIIISIIIIIVIMPLISGSWWWNYPELLTGLFIFNIIISIIFTIIIFKPSPSS